MFSLRKRVDALERKMKCNDGYHQWEYNHKTIFSYRPGVMCGVVHCKYCNEPHPTLKHMESNDGA